MMDKEFVEEHFGCYPVLFIGLSEVAGNPDEIKVKLANKINELFVSNKHLILFMESKLEEAISIGNFFINNQ
jgi:hypothetical protein